MKLTDDVRFIKGIGEARAKALASLGIYKAEDLLTYYPTDYENRGNVRKICECNDGEKASVIVKVETQPKKGYGKKGINYTKVCLSDDTGTLYATFFNQKWISDALTVGRKFRLYGRITPGLYGYETVNPILEPAEGKLCDIEPIYKLCEGVTGSMLRRAITQVMPLADELPEVLPNEILSEYGLIKKSEAVRLIHFPENEDEKKSAVRRLAFEELTVFQLALCRLRSGMVTKKSYCMSLEKTGIRKFFENLPFELTGAQKSAVKDVIDDMRTSVPMMRLIQGDVGSGKTVISVAATYFAVKNGYQVAVMAPTEILASQHAVTFDKMLSAFGIKTVLLTGSLTAKQKQNVKEKIMSGDADVIIGTNAVIQSGVEFYKLGLVVTDEQHRFGVMQRASLIDKGAEFTPHTLVMSATPIPRTLSLVLYGDLDLSVVNELPPGRQKTETYTLPSSDTERLNTFLRREISKGRQAYVVCPLVSESEKVDALSAEEKYEYLSSALPEYKTELLHGKMKSKDKNEIMARFKSGETNILVSTTVIEVGVDVPNATVMVVENAERFGLSTLHQLRGRIGRGKEKSYCILVYDKSVGKAKERLETMCRTTDGFEIAQADLKLRGPGDFFGERQSGEMTFGVANIADTVLIEETRTCVNKIAEHNLLSLPGYSALADETEKLYRKNIDRNIMN